MDIVIGIRIGATITITIGGLWLLVQFGKAMKH